MAHQARPSLSTNDLTLPSEQATTTAAQEPPRKRPRGFTTSITNAVAAPRLKSQRSFRALASRTAEENASKRPFFDLGLAGRSSSFVFPHGRRTSQPAEPNLSRAQSFNVAVGLPPTTSPPFTAQDRALRQDTTPSPQDAQAGAQEGFYGQPIALASPLDLTPLSRVTSRESSTPPRKGSDTIDDDLAPITTVVRLNSRSFKKQASTKVSSRRPSHQGTDPQSLGDFAQEHLFASFREQAELKIDDWSSPVRAQTEIGIDEICGAGVDISFDQLLLAIGHIARHRPNAFIERLIEWRDGYSKAGVMRKGDGMTAPSSNAMNGGAVDNRASHFQAGPEVAIVDSETLVAGRRSSVSVYLFCRVLIEILRRTTYYDVGSAMLSRLIETAYHTLRIITNQHLARFSVKRAQWIVVNEMLGALAVLDFEAVSQKFLAELKMFHKELSVKTAAAKAMVNEHTEAEAVHLMRSMRFLRLQAESEKAWKRSCAFMKTIADLFATVHGQAVKTAFCKLIQAVLLPLASKVLTDFDDPDWKQVVAILNGRLSHLADKQNIFSNLAEKQKMPVEKSQKSKYWHVAFPALAILACVSPQEAFNRYWQQHVEKKQLERLLRERHNRAHALKATCRLLWSYIQRTTDRPDSVAQYLDSLARIVFQSGKTYSLSTEPAIAEPLIQLIRIIGYKNEDVCFKTILFPLLNYELLHEREAKDLKFEQIDPDKTVIGIRSFLAVLSDLESKEVPSFPLHFDDERFDDPTSSYLQLTLGRQRPHSRRPMSLKADRLAKPVVTDNFSDSTKQYFSIFCDLLVKVAISCDSVLSSNTPAEDKVSPLPSASRQSLAPVFTIHKREDINSTGENRYTFYELVRVTVLALPRCLTSRSPLPVLGLLCTGTAHPDRDVAFACATSLNSIARQGYGRLVAERLNSFLTSYDNRIFVQLVDGAVRSSSHLETVLGLYLELLNIWLRDLRDAEQEHKRTMSQESTTYSITRSDAGTWTQIDRIESQGLFFLSSPSHRVRTYACELLDLVTKFDAALQQENPRIATVLSDTSIIVQKLQDETLSSFERSILERGLRRSSHMGAIAELCCHSGDQEGALWHKLYPSVVRASFESCPVAVTQTRETISARLSSMHAVIADIEDRARSRAYSPAFETSPHRMRPAGSGSTSKIMQWKLYLIFVCMTLTRTDASTPIMHPQVSHVRNSSKSSQKVLEPIITASDLFAKVVPMLNAQDITIRAAVVAGLGSVNINLYKALLESLERASRLVVDDPRRQLSHQRTPSSPRKTLPPDQFVTDFVEVYKLTSHFLQNPEVRKDEWILAHLARYTRDLSMTVRGSDHLRLKINYCGLIDKFYAGIAQTVEPERWVTFETRRAAFTLMESWCDLSMHSNQHGGFDRSLRQVSMEAGGAHSGSAWAAQERNHLRSAAQNAMATLCCGPVRSVVNNGNGVQSFNVHRMLIWIDDMLRTESDKIHATARRALTNLITQNINYPDLLDFVIGQLYLATTAKGLESYVEVISDVLMRTDAPPVPIWKILSALLFILGSDRSAVRMKSARLLRFFDEKQRRGSKLQDLEISISDDTKAINKAAHYEISHRLAREHSEHAFFVFSEFSKHFSKLEADNRRNIVLSLLPWIQTIELQLDPAGGVTASSYMLLVNLIQMTINHSDTMHHEIQALWQALATGPHAGNVKLILDFIIELILDRRDARLVQVAKHIVVFLSKTQAGQKVIEFLLLQINPRTMWEETGRTVNQPADVEQFPYLAELSQMSPMSSPIPGRGGNDGGGLSNMSLGHLCLILLVDLIIGAVTLPVDLTTLLLHTVLILWDHRMEVVRDQAREMLLHLVHQLVVLKMNDDLTLGQSKLIEDFIELIRHQDSKVIWKYEDNNGRSSDFELVEPMTFVIKEVVSIFSIPYPGIETAWGRVTMNWATICPVRHLACRSLQIYRCLLQPLDATVVSGLLSRLGISLGDETVITQTYSMDILRTLRTIVMSLDGESLTLLPPLFWTTWTCLGSTNEAEFMEALEMLDVMLEKKFLDDPATVTALDESKPANVDWAADSLITLVTQGARSATTMGKCLTVLNKLIHMPFRSQFVGHTKGFLLTILAHLPHMAHFLQDERAGKHIIAANILADVATHNSYDTISKIFTDFATYNITESQDLLTQSIEALRFYFFPGLEVTALKFLVGLLNNSQTWFKAEVLQMLEIVLAPMDLHKQEIVEHGVDLLAPLLRLLNTELAGPALKILDHFTEIPGTKLHQQQLRMSMTTATSSQERRRFERTESLYGIPESSGWSIPKPAVRRESLRRDMLAIHDAFMGDATIGNNGLPTPGIVFYKEDRLYGSYFPEQSTAMSSVEVHLAETNVGELVDKLEALDDFFEESDATETGSQYYSHSPHFHFNHQKPAGYIRHGPYDSFSSVLGASSAQSSFTSTTSTRAPNYSFNNSYNSNNSLRIPHLAEPIAMSPSAFNPPSSHSQSHSQAHALAHLHIRPELQPRTLSSPGPQQTHFHHRTPPKVRSSGDEASEDEVLSSTSNGSAIEQKMRFSKGSFNRGFRTGFRRLTGGTDGKSGHAARVGGSMSAGASGRMRSYERDGSPEVPKVPEKWRN